MSKTPKNSLQYKDIEPIVEYLISVKARQHTFDCWDVDDVSQEIRIICLNAMKEFDQSKIKEEKQVVNYFGRCVDNRLQNLKRDNYIRYTPPFGKQRAEQIENNPNDELYEKYLKHKEYVQRRKLIKHPVNIELIGDMPLKFSTEEDIIADDIQNHILSNIDEEFRDYVKEIFNGGKPDIDEEILLALQLNIQELLENCE